MWIKLLIGIMIIAAIGTGASFYYSSVDQSTAADLLALKVKADTLNYSTVSNQTKGIENEIAGLGSQINQAQTTLNQQTRTLPEMTNSNVILTKVITYGDLSGVTAITLGTKDWTSIRIDKNEYHVFRMSLQAKGSQPKVIDYFKQIQNSIDPYLVIEHLNLTPISKTESTDIDTQANLDIAIYAR
jgi:hypothetical protein